MIVPPSPPPEQANALGGFEVLLRDQQNQPVLRFSRSNPIRHDAEVFSPPGADQWIARVPVDRPRGSFVLLVPDVPGASTLELIGPSASVNAFREQPRSLARFALRPFEGR